MEKTSQLTDTNPQTEGTYTNPQTEDTLTDKNMDLYDITKPPFFKSPPSPSSSTIETKIGLAPPSPPSSPSSSSTIETKIGLAPPSPPPLSLQLSSPPPSPPSSPSSSSTIETKSTHSSPKNKTLSTKENYDNNNTLISEQDPYVLVNNVNPLFILPGSTELKSDLKEAVNNNELAKKMQLAERINDFFNSIKKFPKWYLATHKENPFLGLDRIIVDVDEKLDMNDVITEPLTKTWEEFQLYPIKYFLSPVVEDKPERLTYWINYRYNGVALDENQRTTMNIYYQVVKYYENFTTDNKNKELAKNVMKNIENMSNHYNAIKEWCTSLDKKGPEWMKWCENFNTWNEKKNFEFPDIDIEEFLNENRKNELREHRESFIKRIKKLNDTMTKKANQEVGEEEFKTARKNWETILQLNLLVANIELELYKMENPIPENPENSNPPPGWKFNIFNYPRYKIYEKINKKVENLYNEYYKNLNELEKKRAKAEKDLTRFKGGKRKQREKQRKTKRKQRKTKRKQREKRKENKEKQKENKEK